MCGYAILSFGIGACSQTPGAAGKWLRSNHLMLQSLRSFHWAEDSGLSAAVTFVTRAKLRYGRPFTTPCTAVF
jgi:hypothetical protein